MDWSNITSSQFEDLAFLYAKNTYKDLKWIPTHKTRDGNKDGEFEDEISAINMIYKGWYEAKYTKNQDVPIPKAHMDSTLVSGILDGYVALIIFITNGKITRDFRRRAKAILTPFKIKVEFVEGDILEQWLLSNDKIYNKYFEKISATPTSLTSEVRIDDVCFFDGIMTPSALTTPLLKLQQNEQYYIYISIRSNISTIVKINWNLSELSYIPNGENKCVFSLVPGFNSFLIKVYTNDICSKALVIKISSEDGLLDKYELPQLSIENPNIPKLVYSNQMSIIQHIYNFNIKEKSKNMILTVKGKSGYGKSYLLRKTAGSLIDYHVNLLTIEFSDKSAENASLFCKLILFINFGMLYNVSDEAFLELIKDAVNLPIEIYLQLKEGIDNQIAALNIVNRLNNLLKTQDYSLILSKSILDNTISYIIIDDVQKINKTVAELFVKVLIDFKNKSSGQMLILGYRPNEFTEAWLEEKITSCKTQSWNLNNIKYSDVKLSIEKNISKSISDLSDLFPMPINILHLYLLIRKLKQKNIQSLPYEKRIQCFQKIYIETNVQNGSYTVHKIKNCQYSKILFIIYKVESGVPASYLIEYYDQKGEEAVCYLLENQLIKNDNDILKPFHDTYLYAFLNIEYSSDYLTELEKFLLFCIEKKENDSILISNMISVIIFESDSLKYTYKETILKMCCRYFNKSQYNAAKKLAEVLLPELDGLSPADFSENDLLPLFIYAQSIKYSESHFASDKFLQLLCDIGETQSLFSEKRNIIYEAHSELLSNAIWELNIQEAKKQIKFLDNELGHSVNNDSSIYRRNAYLILLNRKILYNSIFEKIETSDNLYQTAITESLRLGQKDYAGYALMDHAKNIIVDNPSESIKNLKHALNIFKQYPHCRKRFLDCQAEIIFLSAIYRNESFNELYDVQHLALIEKLGHVYTKTTLKIIALEIKNGYKTENINKKLDKLILQYPDICSRYRLHLFYFMLKAAVCCLDGNANSFKKWNSKYCEMAETLSADYRYVPEHNLTLSNPVNTILWYYNGINDSQAFWLEPRIW